MRFAIVDEKKCEPRKCDNLCFRLCPRNKLEEKCIEIGETAKIDENLCVGCGICSNRCPFGAIKIVNTPEKAGFLVHRYGENKFALYNLPLPEKGKITGIIGRNGIGKSTAMKIISGLQQVDTKDMPTLMKQYFQKKRSVSLKPQVLENLTSKDLNREMIDLFGIREKEHYSGGELQKLNIAKCLSKDADLYILDEPTSYLDVYERLRIAKIIKERLRDREVLVVEHDLAILDYLSEQICVLFGTPGGYGVVSSKYSTLRGINNYLEGYLPTENVRVRKDPIKFDISATEELGKDRLLGFSNIEKALGDFSLKVEHGDLNRGEILGVLGPNAIGKTTFMEMLAGKMAPDKGEVEKAKISYKPQYLYADYEGTVEEIIPKERQFKEQISFPLGLEQLYKKKVKELSGGELQTLAIALCLSKEADIYLLDEPSAFLDIESRLRLVSLLRQIIKDRQACAVVIDHDLHLAVQISNRVLLFEGEPGKLGLARIEKTGIAMNNFLKQLGITFRRDPENNRFKVNKEGSKLDQEQKERGEYLMFK
ncbi:MAG: ribosome biogenesis/translation initiation ATPase RLI [Candidatus Aenigmarchaeota archaeon]|nr:ribosome biogenesis/translation initiation ATPase RLI [Candidatus Aenigmarchaeota archaeon]